MTEHIIIGESARSTPSPHGATEAQRHRGGSKVPYLLQGYTPSGLVFFYLVPTSKDFTISPLYCEWGPDLQSLGAI